MTVGFTPFKVVVFCPVDGFSHFTLPIGSALPGLEFALPSSELSLVEGGKTLRLSRVTETDTWIALHEQVYDKLGQRLGHTFGVGIFMSNKTFDPQAHLEILEVIRDLLYDECVTDGRRFDGSAFLDRTWPQLSERFGAFEENWKNRFNSSVPIGSGLNSRSLKTGSIPISGWESKSEIAKAIEWALISPGARQFHTLLISKKTDGVVANQVQLIESLERENFREFQHSTGERDARISELSLQVDTLSKDNQAITRACDDFNSRNAQLAIDYQTLEKANRDLLTAGRSSFPNKTQNVDDAQSQSSRNLGNLAADITRLHTQHLQFSNYVKARLPRHNFLLTILVCLLSILIALTGTLFYFAYVESRQMIEKLSQSKSEAERQRELLESLNGLALEQKAAAKKAKEDTSTSPNQASKPAKASDKKSNSPR